MAVNAVRHNDADEALDSTKGAARSASLSGRQLGVYQLGELLGSGGMAEVYAAYDPRLKRDVAIKVVHAEFSEDPERLQRLEREARAAAALNHPNILAVHDIGTHEGLPYIVMERVPGETLATRLKGERPGLRWTLDVGIQIADALAAVHARGIHHRDLKPGNVMLTPDGRVKVVDFGLAKPTATDTPTTQAASGFETRSGQIFGTPAYMAPEQFGGSSDHRADIYSLGVILFELVTGRRPFQGHDFVSIMMNRMSLPTPSVGDFDTSVPAPLSYVISRCLSNEPAGRPASAAALKSELEQIRSALGTFEAGSGSPLAQWMKSLRRPHVGGAALTAIVLLIAAIGVSRWRAPTVLPPPEHPVIAVLPLENLSGQASNDYLGLGISDALTTSLSKLSSVTVVSRETTRDSARGTADSATLARELGANLMVQGSLQRTGDRLRIDAKLVRPDNTVVWAGDAEAPLADLFALERQLADRLVEALRVRVSATERQQLAVPPTKNQDALEAYWRGMALLERTDVEGVDQAIMTLERSIDLDPKFAVAYAGLGAAFVRKYNATNDGGWMKQATEAVTKALEIDPSQTTVRLSLANVYRSTGRNGSAVEELRRVLAEEPTNDEARRRLGLIFESEGRNEEALEQYQSAVDQRPTYWLNHDVLGLFHFRMGRFQDAARAFARVTDLRPDSAQAYQRLGTAYQLLGDKARAREYLERAITITPDATSYSNLGTIHYSDGRFNDAAQAYRDAIRLRPNRALYHRNLGDTYRRMGQASEAQSEYQEAARLTSEALAVNPNDARTMAQLAVYEAKIGRRADAERHISRALAINPADPEVLFRRAAVLALRGDSASALEALSEAVTKGFAVDLVRDDDDLASLRAIPRFQSLVSPKK